MWNKYINHLDFICENIILDWDVMTSKLINYSELVNIKQCFAHFLENEFDIV